MAQERISNSSRGETGTLDKRAELVGERSTCIRHRGPREETFAAPFAGAPQKSNAIYA